MLHDIQPISIASSAARFSADGDPHRALVFLFDYWRLKRAGRLAPTRSDIQPEEMKQVLPHLLLLDLVGAPSRLKYRLAGSEFVRVYGAEVTGQYLDELDFDGVKAFVLADYWRVADSGEPSWTKWSFVKEDGRLLEYERLALPLSSDGSRIDMILAGVVGTGLPLPESHR